MVGCVLKALRYRGLVPEGAESDVANTALIGFSWRGRNRCCCRDVWS